MGEQPALSFAGLLRQLRAEARLTQEELAEAAGVSPRSVSDLERGLHATAHKDTALLLAGALSLEEPARDLFVAAARGRVPAAEVLAAAGRAGMHGFPPALTSFVGRRAELAEVMGLLARYRLVTVTGPGGVGKTRLAGTVARRVAGRFADGVWLVELAAVSDPARVAPVVAAAVGVPERPGVAAADALAEALAGWQVLLVLDNCEQVIDAVSALGKRVLSVADEVRLLVTSREQTGVARETRYRLGPLGLPGPGQPTAAGEPEAVALFADRARQADPLFRLDGATRPVVARLVARLDGIPLAIELAAARVEALGVGPLLDRLDDQFTLLASPDRTAAPRHRSLAATVQWSYQLLREEEQQVFRKLAVFPGPFTLDGAEAVAGPAATSAVLRLVECSLLVPPRTGSDGRARYLLLDTLRAFGAARLADAGERPAAAAALAGFALGVAEQAAAGLETVGPAELTSAAWLDAEDAALRQSLGWALDHDPDAALRLAVVLGPWWLSQGRPAEVYAWLQEAVKQATRGSDAWCAAQCWLGRAALPARDAGTALGHFTAVCEAIGDRAASRVLADCLSGRSASQANLGRFHDAAEDGRRSLALSGELGYPAGQVLALMALSVAAYYVSNLEEAVAWIRRAQAIDPAAIPGWVARVCDPVITGVLIEAGELPDARRTCFEALARCHEAGDLTGQASLLVLHARLGRLAGDPAGAGAHLAEAARLAARIGDRVELGNCVDEAGYQCAAAGRWAEAITLWAAYAASLRQDGLAEVPHEADRRKEPMRRALAALEPAKARAAEQRGAAMTLNTIAELAAMITTGHGQATAAGKLSARERELITLVAQGRTDAQIAAQLSISPWTVASHLDRIRDKTGCQRRADLTRLALTESLV